MVSGGRDFNELNAKFEKQLRRLPDYAQRAQQQLAKYTQNEPSEPATRDGAGAVEPGERRDPAGSAGTKSVPTPAELPVVSEIRGKWQRWNDPAAKLQRRTRRTSRAVTLWTVLTLLSVLWAVVGYAGIVGFEEGGVRGALSGLTATLIFGTLGVRSSIRLYQLKRTPLPQSAPEPPVLPAAGSVAREPMENLQRSEASLAELLGQLENPHGTSASVPEISVEEARGTATEAAAALRALATRIQSIERARESAPPAERPALDSAVESLRSQLQDGMDGYGALVAAAGRAVAASSSGVETAKQPLTDATDRLAGLAFALRELSGEN